MGDFFSSTSQRLRDIRGLQRGEHQMNECMQLLDQLDSYVSQRRLNNYERVLILKIRRELTNAMLDNSTDYMRDWIRHI